MAAGGLRQQHDHLVASSAHICDSITMFESVRRRVYGHVGWEYPLVTPGTETRSSGLFNCTLVSSCRTCNGQHTSLPRKAYLMWQGYLPVKCDHGGNITGIYVEPEGRGQHQAVVIMPERVIPVNPAGASETSGGEVTVTKLERDLERVRARSGECMRHLRAQIHESEVQPPPFFFPELQLEVLREKVSYIETKTDDLLDILETRIRAGKRAEGTAEIERPEDGHQPALGQQEQQGEGTGGQGEASQHPGRGVVSHSTPQRNAHPTDSQGRALQPPPFPDNLRQQLMDRGGQLDNAGFVPPQGDISVEDVEAFIRDSQEEGTGDPTGQGSQQQAQGQADGTGNPNAQVQGQQAQGQAGQGQGGQGGAAAQPGGQATSNQEPGGQGAQVTGAGTGTGGLGGPPAAPRDKAALPETQREATGGGGGSFLANRTGDQDLSAGGEFSRLLHRYDPILSRQAATAPHLGAWLASIPSSGTTGQGGPTPSRVFSQAGGSSTRPAD